MKVSEKLKVIKNFQDKYQTAHVGGSFGLLLHGIDLKRDLSKSDIDMTVAEPLPPQIELENYEESSNPSDFDHAFRCRSSVNSEYAKVDVRISPEPSFQIIKFDGVEYNVSLLRNILFWKKKYADKGNKKHILDLIVINGGERPVELVTIEDELDDIPF